MYDRQQIEQDITAHGLPTFKHAWCGDWGEQEAPILALGDALTYDTLGTARGLIPGDAPDPAMSWAGSQHRFPLLGQGPIRSVACNVEITGRHARYKDGGFWIKVRIVWVGHCEPDTQGKGWLRVY